MSHFTSFTTGGQTALARLLLFLWFQSDRTEEKSEVFEYFKQIGVWEQETRDLTLTNIV